MNFFVSFRFEFCFFSSHLKDKCVPFAFLPLLILLHFVSLLHTLKQRLDWLVTDVVHQAEVVPQVGLEFFKCMQNKAEAEQTLLY